MARISSAAAKAMGIPTDAGVGINMAMLTGGLTVKLPAEAQEPRSRVPAVDRLQVVLPLPPTTNNLFLNTKSPTRPRVKTPEYRAWIVKAEQALTLAHPVRAPVAIRIYVRPGRGLICTSDIENRSKAIADILVARGVLPNDNIQYVHSVTCEYRPLPAPAKGIPSVAIVVVEHTLVGSVPLGALPNDPQLE